MVAILVVHVYLGFPVRQNKIDISSRWNWYETLESHVRCSFLFLHILINKLATLIPRSFWFQKQTKDLIAVATLLAFQ